jgi:hypothetical protein
MGKETGTSVLHTDQMAISDKTLEPKKEKIRVSLAYKMIDVDLITNNITRPGKSPVEFNGRIQEPITPSSFDRMVNAQVRAQKKVGLPGFDRYAHRSTATV